MLDIKLMLLFINFVNFFLNVKEKVIQMYCFFYILFKVGAKAFILDFNQNNVVQ